MRYPFWGLEKTASLGLNGLVGSRRNVSEGQALNGCFGDKSRRDRLRWLDTSTGGQRGSQRGSQWESVEILMAVGLNRDFHLQNNGHRSCWCYFFTAATG